MILVWFMDLFYFVFDTLLGWINLPLFEDINAVNDVINLMVSNGAGLVKFFFNPFVFKVILTMFIALEAVDTLYWFIMWILKKIPMAGMQ